jgi:tRNA1(Val) A37 N6-methylase TrmN6
MASLFPPSALDTCRLLDAGAGVGALSCAFLERCSSGEEFNFKSIEASAYEVDPELRAHLQQTLAAYVSQLPLRYFVSSEDFIPAAAVRSFQGLGRFTHAIMNPPYKKISSDSPHRLILRRAGIETVNLYSAFVALALMLMEPGGATGRDHTQKLLQRTVLQAFSRFSFGPRSDSPHPSICVAKYGFQGRRRVAGEHHHPAGTGWFTRTCHHIEFNR